MEPTTTTAMPDGAVPAATSTGMNVEQVVNDITYRYQTGFGNEFASEVLPGALPVGRNTPRHVPYNLYAEQLSGTAFTTPRAVNKRSWLYRIQPSVVVSNAGMGKSTKREAAATAHSASDDTKETTTTTIGQNLRLNQYFGGCSPTECIPTVDPCRWHPMPNPTDAAASQRLDFVQAMKLVCHSGDPALKHGLAIYQYSGVNESMSTGSGGSSSSSNRSDTHMVNADGDFLIVPCAGTLQILTELGRLTVAPTEIVVIPRGIVFQVNLLTTSNRSSSTDDAHTEQSGAVGYVLEVYTLLGFQLPELGPIGSNGLANARDFLYPVAWCAATSIKAYQTPCRIVTKLQSQLYRRTMPHSPYNVVAWHGNYAPYKYDLKRFCAVNSVTYDHLDPSLYTVLTCPSGTPGVALADFVIFPPRVLATDANTLRPPWFHRNCMSEYMGLIYGQYDAKQTGFRPGGSSLHNCMVPHGPDADAYTKAVADPCDTPTKLDGGMAFMFETCLTLQVAPQAWNNVEWRDVHYADCWQTLSAENFTGWDALALSLSSGNM